MVIGVGRGGKEGSPPLGVETLYISVKCLAKKLFS